jgi:PhnB protein
MLTLNPYLSFKDNAREAIEFYHGVFGGELNITTFADFPGSVDDPAENDLVMHSQLTSPEGLVLMASDTPSRMSYEAPAGIAVSLSGEDDPQMQRYWEALAEGGTVTMPYDTPPWGGKFGMLRDRFGIDWMLTLNAPQG